MRGSAPDVMRIRVLAEFESAEAVKSAAAAMRGHGYTLVEGFAPWEVEGLEDALALPRGRIPLFTLLAGLLGAAVGYGIQWWTNTVDFPLNVGGRPMHPFPSYVMITFETAILFASIAAFLGVIVGSRLPMLWQPLFDVPGFDRVNDDAFFLGIDERDPLFEFERTAGDLRSAGALHVERVPGGLGADNAVVPLRPEES